MVPKDYRNSDFLKMISELKENYSFHYDVDTKTQTCRFFQGGGLYVYQLNTGLREHFWDLVN
jgi:hypothetical protein